MNKTRLTLFKYSRKLYVQYIRTYTQNFENNKNDVWNEIKVFLVLWFYLQMPARILLHTYTVHTYTVHTYTVHTYTVHTYTVHTYMYIHTLYIHTLYIHTLYIHTLYIHTYVHTYMHDMTICRVAKQLQAAHIVSTGSKNLHFPSYILVPTYVRTYSMGHKKVPVFRNTLPCNGNFAFRVRFRSVLQFSVFLLLCQHFKSTAQRTVKER